MELNQQELECNEMNAHLVYRSSLVRLKFYLLTFNNRGHLLQSIEDPALLG